MVFDEMEEIDVYALTLNDDGSPWNTGEYIHLPSPFRPYVLRFIIDNASSISHRGTFHTNYPRSGATFSRDVFQEFPLKPNYQTSIEVDILINKSGVYAFYISYEEIPDWDPFTEVSNSCRKINSKTFYYNVSADLRINDTALPINGLAVQSVIGKWMGPLDQWTAYIERISSRGYNMVHFTPLQPRGISDSPYSILEQVDFSHDLFSKSVATPRERIEAMRDYIHHMEFQYGLLSMTDIVWNHTANNSDWLLDHPEAGYNLENSPHLKGAYILEKQLLNYSSSLKNLNLPTELHNTNDLVNIIKGLRPHVFEVIRLWEFYVVNVNRAVADALRSWKAGEIDNRYCETDLENMTLVQQVSELKRDALIHKTSLNDRFHKYVDSKLAAGFLQQLFGDYIMDREQQAKEKISSVIDALNLPLYKRYDEDCLVIEKELKNQIYYARLDENGPRLGPITLQRPLITTYFTILPKCERTEVFSEETLILANNGWVQNYKPMTDFASSSSNAYLRREVIVWSDCVKLRYGDGPSANLWLWEHMKKYTVTMASIFHSFRIDNCHSTPLKVATYLLDAARATRPNLYVVAELFTNSVEMDIIYVNQLGIGSLIREAMQANSVAELSKLVHQHSGRPIGSLDKECLIKLGEMKINDSKMVRTRIHPIIYRPVDAYFIDCTHDNETPHQKRVVEDALSTAALVTICGSVVGSVFGFDELYPKLLNLVQEKRRYGLLAMEGGVVELKKIMNRLHVKMANEHYAETYINHENAYITVHRTNPSTMEGYFLIAHTAFQSGNERGVVSPVVLEDMEVKHMFSYCLSVISRSTPKDDTCIEGFPSKLISLQCPTIRVDSNKAIIEIPDYFPPGSISLFRTNVNGYDKELVTFLKTDAKIMTSSLDLLDLNILLFRCDAEERDMVDPGFGVYYVPNFGPLVYAGLQGWMSVLEDVVARNDLGHPICDHLRSGFWAMDYIINRLKMYKIQFPRLQTAIDWLKIRFGKIKLVPKFLTPKLFTIVIQTAFIAARRCAISQMSTFVLHGDNFVKNLAMTSIQLQGIVKSSTIKSKTTVPSLAAGLPHFSTGYMRTWGRDTFISLRGIFLTTGRYDEALQHILAFASTLKHGLIPNLLDSLKNPRYNSRDAVWFMLQAIQDYYAMAPCGQDLLQMVVKRRFPLDDTFVDIDDAKAYSHESTIVEVIQEIMQRHALGISYQEANAGPSLDSAMSPAGFEVNIQVDWNTGLIFGGSVWNCGTWQDKMGSSDKAGNKGVPATPRDGAPIELSGLLKSTLRWICELSKTKIFPFEGVKNSNGQNITYLDWNLKVQESFEKCYYVPLTAEEDEEYDIDIKLVNRRGIYKDLYRTSKPFEDYQFRANFSIAMVVAPELFTLSNALNTLYLADRILRGPLGMRTLDPQDSHYIPFYDNSNSTNDYSVAAGFSYHQGPEWVWIAGFFFRAFLHFDMLRRTSKAEAVKTLHQLQRRVSAHRQMIRNSFWAGLVELTNKNGEPCPDSCQTQAWSSASMLGIIQLALVHSLTFQISFMIPICIIVIMKLVNSEQQLRLYQVKTYTIKLPLIFVTVNAVVNLSVAAQIISTMAYRANLPSMVVDGENFPT